MSIGALFVHIDSVILLHSYQYVTLFVAPCGALM
jgi:hypothetical protein